MSFSGISFCNTLRIQSSSALICSCRGFVSFRDFMSSIHAYPVCCQIRPPDLFSGHGDARLSRFPA
jgi:hypothetical protein